MENSTCPICEKSVPTRGTGRGAQKKYCSDECRAEGRRRRYQEWYARHGNDPEVRERQHRNRRRYYEKNRERIIRSQITRAQTPKVRRKRRDSQLKRAYGITIEQYDELLEQQNHLCGICREAKKLVVDHDHQTGAVRGLLCNPCNRHLGGLGDTEESLEAALAYLHNPKRHTERLVKAERE